MDYELARRLKDIGFPQGRLGSPGYVLTMDVLEGKEEPVNVNDVYYPTLSDLIEACGDRFRALCHEKRTTSFEEWYATDGSLIWREDCSWGSTPEEAVAKLWIALQEAKKVP